MLFKNKIKTFLVKKKKFKLHLLYWHKRWSKRRFIKGRSIMGSDCCSHITYATSLSIFMWKILNYLVYYLSMIYWDYEQAERFLLLPFCSSFLSHLISLYIFSLHFNYTFNYFAKPISLSYLHFSYAIIFISKPSFVIKLINSVTNS